MNLNLAYARIRQLDFPVFRTADVVALLHINTSHASQILRRLVRHQLAIPLGRGRWTLDAVADRFIVAEQLCTPHPSYISLQSALYHHGMISQIPQVIYSVTLGKTKRLTNPLGTFSYHHLSPAMFHGFETISPQGGQMASPEKALLDLFYLSANNPRLFKALPELELPTDFKRDYCLEVIKNIRSQRQKTATLRRYWNCVEKIPSALGKSRGGSGSAP